MQRHLPFPDVAEAEVFLSVLAIGEIRRGIESVRRRDPDFAAAREALARPAQQGPQRPDPPDRPARSRRSGARMNNSGVRGTGVPDGRRPLAVLVLIGERLWVPSRAAHFS
jgi:hypothetical protein